MATILREVLNADQMKLIIFCGQQSKVGIGLSGTWVGTVAFRASTDGVNFTSVTVAPFASGTAVSSVTTTGNWEFDVKNYVAFQVVFTRTSGSVVAQLAASIDSSYQDAFLASTSIFVSQGATGGAANTITQAAQANRAWRLRTLSGGFSVAPSAAVKVTVSDGGSATIWEEYLAAAAGPWKLQLPLDSNVPGVTGGGVVGTPGNSLVVTIAAPGGSVATSASAEFHPA